MSPLAKSNGHDAPRLIGEAVPSEAAIIEDVVVGFEDAVREPVVAHELPDVFDRVELGALWSATRHWHNGSGSHSVRVRVRGESRINPLNGELKDCNCQELGGASILGLLSSP